MRVVVIGGTGHIGTYLVPRLVRAGHDVTSVSRRKRAPYRDDEAWSSVTDVNIDREAEEAAGTFGESIAALGPQVVVDLICFTVESAAHVVQTLTNRVEHFLHCGTIWVHGPSVEVPTTEAAPRGGFGEYGSRKAAIERLLLERARTEDFPVTLVHPGHLVGPGWAPVNPAGHFNPEVFSTLATGGELRLPNFGMETLHHVHADDVAQVFERALSRRQAAIGESFHAVSTAALSLRGYAERMSAWFGREPRLRFVSWDDWKQGVPERDAETSFNHICRSSNCSIEKARRLLDYAPRYSSLEAVQESVTWLLEHGVVRRA
jgi:nucleoside-diphosphate-sugar epimerase